MGETQMRFRKVMSRIFKGVNRLTGPGCRIAIAGNQLRRILWENLKLRPRNHIQVDGASPSNKGVEPRENASNLRDRRYSAARHDHYTAVAEPQGSAPRPLVNVQLNTEFLNDLMRSAMIFNGMVQNLNLNKTLHDSGVAPDSNTTQMKRTAAVLGAGAGIGFGRGRDDAAAKRAP